MKKQIIAAIAAVSIVSVIAYGVYTTSPKAAAKQDTVANPADYQINVKTSKPSAQDEADLKTAFIDPMMFARITSMDYRDSHKNKLEYLPTFTIHTKVMKDEKGFFAIQDGVRNNCVEMAYSFNRTYKSIPLHSLTCTGTANETALVDVFPLDHDGSYTVISSLWVRAYGLTDKPELPFYMPMSDICHNYETAMGKAYCGVFDKVLTKYFHGQQKEMIHVGNSAYQDNNTSNVYVLGKGKDLVQVIEGNILQGNSTMQQLNYMAMDICHKTPNDPICSVKLPTVEPWYEMIASRD